MSAPYTDSRTPKVYSILKEPIYVLKVKSILGYHLEDTL